MGNREDEYLLEMRIERDIQNTQADQSVQKTLLYFLAKKIITPERARASLRRL